MALLPIQVKVSGISQVDTLDKKLNTLEKNTNSTTASTDSLTSSFKNLAIGTGAVVLGIKAIDTALNATKLGVKFNSNIESMTAGLTVLTASISSNTTAMGKTIDVTEKYALANIEAKDTVAALVEVNQQTPHSLTQTVEIYKSMFSSMKKAGATTEETIEITKQLSIAASSAGIEFQQLLAGADGLADGMVMPNSELGRFLKTLGLTNEVLKESTNVVQTITDKLSDVQAIQTYEIAVSNLANSFEALAGTATKGLFEDVKTGVTGATIWINKLNDSLTDYLNNINNIQDVHKQSQISVLEHELEQLTEAYNNNSKSIFQSATNYDAEQKKQLLLIETTKRRIAALKEQKKAEDSLVVDLGTITASPTVTATDTMSQSLASWQEYYTKLGDYQTAWLFEEAEINAKYKDLTEAQLNEVLGIYKTEFFDKFKDQSSELAQNLRDEMEAFQNFELNIDVSGFDDISKGLVQTSKTFKAIGKEQKSFNKLTEKYNKLNEEGLTTDEDKEEYSKVQDAHLTNQIDGYGALAGAMAGAFDEGSKEAEALIAIQKVLSVVTGVTAIANAMSSGDPYTAVARGLAVAATLASFGWSGSGSASSSDFSTTQESMTRTTVLGAGDETSQSISNSLEILEDFAEPQYGVLSEMRAYLKSIDSNLKNVGLDLIRTAGFALGEGSVNSSTATISANQKKSYEITKNLDNVLAYASGMNTMESAMGGIFGEDFTELRGIFTGSNVSNKLADMVFGGGYEWKRLAGSGVNFGTTDATVGTTYSAKESNYIGAGETAKSWQDFTAQTLGGLIDDFQGLLFQTTAREKSSKSTFGSTKYKYYSYTQYQEMEQELENSFVKTFANLRGTILTGSEILNTEVEKDLNNLTVDIGQIDLSGIEDSDEIGEILNTKFSEQADKFITSLYGQTLGAFQDVGEGLYETFVRVSAGMGEADYYLNKLGSDFETVDFKDITNKYGDVAIEALRESITKYDEALYGASNGVVDLLELVTSSAEDIYDTYNQLDDARLMFDTLSLSLDGLSQSTIVGTDGIDGLSDSLETVIENLLPETEKSIFTVNKVTAEFEKLNLTVPTTTEGFIELIQSIDATTEAGQELLGRTLALADEFSELAEIMETSAENIKDFTDSFKTSDELLQDMADTMGVEVATNISELAGLFEQLANDTQGLTDAELELLEANKSIIEEQNDYANSISTLQGALTSIQSTIDKLRGAAIGGTYGLEQYYASMNKTVELSKENDTDAFIESLNKSISYTSALLQSDNFNSAAEQEFAQIVAANQFENLQIDTQTEIDYLKEISENTKLTYEALLASLSDIGKSLVSQSVSNVGNNIVTKSTSSVVQDLYDKYDLNQYQTDNSGYENWQSLLDSGSINLNNIEDMIVESANDVLKDMGIDRTITPFAKGGVVNQPTMALFGEAGTEAFVPLPDGKNIPVVMNGNNEIDMAMLTKLTNIESLLNRMSEGGDAMNIRMVG